MEVTKDSQHNQTNNIREYYHKVWYPTVNDRSQRDTMLEVLLQFNLLEEEDVNLKVTGEGYRFLQWLGIIPLPPHEP